MRYPAPDEQQIAVILLDKAELGPDTRAVLERIVRGELVPKEALVLLRSLADSYVQHKFGVGLDKPA